MNRKTITLVFLGRTSENSGKLVAVNSLQCITWTKPELVVYWCATLLTSYHLTLLVLIFHPWVLHGASGAIYRRGVGEAAAAPASWDELLTSVSASPKISNSSHLQVAGELSKIMYI